MQRFWGVVGLGLLVAGPIGASVPPADAEPMAQPARIKPDYQGLIIPPNVAPLNFAIGEPGTAFHVSVTGPAGEPLEVHSHHPRIEFPPVTWRRLVSTNSGRDLKIGISVLGTDGRWRRYPELTNQVAREPVDPTLIYRKIHPAHNSWSTMGIYQRDLTGFEERPILENRRFANDCCHCHSVRNNNPENFTIDIRSSHYDNSLLIVSNGVTTALRGSVGFVAWHPQRPLLVTEVSKPRLMLHTARNDMRDIASLQSWLGYLHLGSNVVHRIPGLTDDARLIGFPAWAPDGHHLYYCSAPNPWTNMAAITANSHTLARYDLMRIPFDSEHETWGTPETILAAPATGFSVAQPRLSPDGRWVFFCAIGYGCWPTYDSQSDLYGLDLKAIDNREPAKPHRLELNSTECESWLSWSSNSRWVVFSSKRLSPLFNRPFLAYVDADGHCAKPFVVPQRDPEYYDSLLRTFTIPTLATGPVTVPERTLVEAITRRDRPTLSVPGITVQPSPDDHP